MLSVGQMRACTAPTQSGSGGRLPAGCGSTGRDSGNDGSIGVAARGPAAASALARQQQQHSRTAASGRCARCPARCGGGPGPLLRQAPPGGPCTVGGVQDRWGCWRHAPRPRGGGASRQRQQRGKGGREGALRGCPAPSLATLHSTPWQCHDRGTYRCRPATACTPRGHDVRGGGCRDLPQRRHVCSAPVCPAQPLPAAGVRQRLRQVASAHPFHRKQQQRALHDLIG